jgi:O-antigen ligase
MEIMEFIPSYFDNTKNLIITFLGAILIGMSVPFLGIYSLGIVLAVVGVIAVAKINLNANTAFLLITSLFYVSILRPFGGYKVLSTLLDVFVVMLIVKFIFLKGIKKGKGILIFVVTAFVALSFIQMFNPNIPELGAGLQGFRKTALPFFLFYVGYLSFKDTEEIRKFIVRISLVASPILLYGIKQHLFISEFDKLFIYANDADIYTGMLFGQTRATSIFAGSFHFGMFGAILAMLNLYLFDTEEIFKRKALFFTMIIISAFACYSSLTRTNLIALVAGLIIYKIFQIKYRNLLILFPILLLSFLSVVSYIISHTQQLMYSDNGLLRMIGTIANLNNDTRFLGRTHGWETVLFLIKERPLIAYGTGSAGDTLGSVYNFQYHVTSHNFFLKILMELGLLGILLVGILFIVIITNTIKKIVSQTDKNTKKFFITCFTVMVIFLINSLVGSTIETYPVSSLILLFMGAGISDITDSKRGVLDKTSGLK